jgi:hypothetical protein
MDRSESWTVTDVAESARYELRRDDGLVGFADYRRRGDVLTIPYVETLVEHRGRGYSEILMAGIVDDARARSLQIRPLCGHLATYLRRRDDIADITDG